MKKIAEILFWFALFGGTIAVASAEDKAKATAPKQNQASSGDSTKAMKFDEDVVEGMDKARLDSLTSKLGREDDDSAHLYRKRTHFRKENQQVSKELVNAP
ncbi:MAG: hypothetical protein AABZ55_11825 [Bdellovibrionota bacterium]